MSLSNVTAAKRAGRACAGIAACGRGEPVDRVLMFNRPHKQIATDAR